MSDQLPTAVLLDPNDGCLTIARSLRSRGIPVTALSTPATDYVAHSRGVRGFRLPALRDAPQAWLDRLDAVGAEGPAVLICGSDAACELVARERHRIPAVLRSFEGPETPHLRLMDKDELSGVAAAIGVRMPWSRRVESHDDLVSAAEAATYPCVIKPVLSHVGKQAGNHRTAEVNSSAELEERVGRALDDGVAMLVSEHVPGPERNLEGAVTVRAADGALAMAYGRIKERQYPLDYGVGSLTRSAPVPGTIEMARRLLDHTGFVGVSGLETKRHAETGELILIEINVRVVQSFGLGDACGVDGSYRLYATLAGLPLGPPPPQRNGIAVVSPAFDLLAARERLARGDVSAGELLRSYRGTRDFGILDVRDPAPGLAFARWAVRSRLAKRRAALMPQPA
jgi:D-aspartate ligase